MAEDVKHRTIRYLQDAHSAQATIESANDAYINDTDDQNLKTLFQGIATQTKSQAQRLEARINALGGDVSGAKTFMGSVIAKAAEVLHGAHDEYDKNTQNLIKAYTAAHGNRAMYESLIAWSSAIADSETETLGKQLQQENVSVAEQIFPHISAYAKTALANTVPSTTSGTYVS